MGNGGGIAPQARVKLAIDAVLTRAGLHVCKLGDANIHAARGVALRELPLNRGLGVADYLLYIDGKAAGLSDTQGNSSVFLRVTQIAQVGKFGVTASILHIARQERVATNRHIPQTMHPSSPRKRRSNYYPQSAQLCRGFTPSRK